MGGHDASITVSLRMIDVVQGTEHISQIEIMIMSDGNLQERRSPERDLRGQELRFGPLA